MFKDSILFLYIAPTMKCNSRCFYCFEEGNKNYGKMSVETEEKLVKFITLHKKQEILIVWFGGEPLLAFDRILSICKKLNENNVIFSSELITNGSLLTPSIIENLSLLSLAYIQTSLDGLCEDHDKRRVFKDGKSSFNIILHNIDNVLDKTKIPISIKVTVDHTNPTAFGDVYRLFSARYPEYVKEKRIVVSPSFVKNRTGFDTKGCCFDSVSMLEEYIKSFDSHSDVCIQPNLPDLVMPCMFRCNHAFAIDSKGYIYRCLEHLGMPSTKVGDLNSGILSNVSMAKTTFQDNPFEDERCISCNFFPVCGGGCPIDRGKQQMGKISNYCSVLKDNLAELLPYFYKYQYKK